MFPNTEYLRKNIEYLVNRYNSGCSIGDLSKEFNCNDTIIARVLREKIELRPWKKAYNLARSQGKWKKRTISKKEYNKLYHIKNKDKHNNSSRIWAIQNREKIRSWNRTKYNEELKFDINYKLKQNLRHRLSCAIKNGKKEMSTLDLTGCSLEQLKNHLESKFSYGMTWSNYGKWHIDHIKPCSSFDLTKPEEQKVCFHYTNLQPLWAFDNLSKNNKYAEKGELYLSVN